MTFGPGHRPALLVRVREYIFPPLLRQRWTIYAVGRKEGSANGRRRSHQKQKDDRKSVSGKRAVISLIPQHTYLQSIEERLSWTRCREIFPPRNVVARCCSKEGGRLLISHSNAEIEDWNDSFDFFFFSSFFLCDPWSLKQENFLRAKIVCGGIVRANKWPFQTYIHAYSFLE